MPFDSTRIRSGYSASKVGVEVKLPRHTIPYPVKAPEADMPDGGKQGPVWLLPSAVRGDRCRSGTRQAGGIFLQVFHWPLILVSVNHDGRLRERMLVIPSWKIRKRKNAGVRATDSEVDASLRLSVTLCGSAAPAEIQWLAILTSTLWKVLWQGKRKPEPNTTSVLKRSNNSLIC